MKFVQVKEFDGLNLIVNVDHILYICPQGCLNNEQSFTIKMLDSTVLHLDKKDYKNFIESLGGVRNGNPDSG